jgi:hypothetical protein
MPETNESHDRQLDAITIACVIALGVFFFAIGFLIGSLIGGFI